jgi:hypothetical protein
MDLPSVEVTRSSQREARTVQFPVREGQVTTTHEDLVGVVDDLSPGAR